MIVAVTGGTGSFGRAFVQRLLSLGRPHLKVRVISRDEHRQADMMRLAPPSPHLTYILTDIGRAERLEEALDGATHVVHAAALKTVEAGERATDEVARVNITGTEAVARAALQARVKAALYISTDKAVAPANAYGKTKAVAEHLWIQAAARGASRGTRFAVVRGGNVWLSRGSVGLRWAQAEAAGQPLPVAAVDMSRFHLEMDWWTGYVGGVLEALVSGNIYVPNVPAWRLHRLAELWGNPAGLQFSPPREADKIHERMIAIEEASRAWRLEDGHFCIRPPETLREVMRYEPPAGRPVEPGFAHTSELAPPCTEDALRAAITQARFAVLREAAHNA